MVNTQNIPSSTDAIIEVLSTGLSRMQQHRQTSQSFVNLAESLYWSLMESQLHDDDTPEIARIRDVLSDILIQWECLQGNQDEATQETQAKEFPPEWIEQWFTQLQQI